MSEELVLRDYFQIIKKRFWLIASIVTAALVLTLVFSIFVQRPMYEASTKIIVNRAPNNTTLQQLDLNEVNTNIRMIDTYKEIIKTPAILDKVIEKYPQFDITVEKLNKKIKVNSVNDTQVMTVIVSDHSYETAAEMVNAVSEVFKEEISGIFNVQNVSILNKAKNNDAEIKPVSPNIPLNLVVAFIVALMLSVGLSFLLEYLDDTIKTEEDVDKYLGLPTLALIVKLNSEDMKAQSNGSNVVRKAGDLSHVTIGK